MTMLGSKPENAKTPDSTSTEAPEKTEESGNDDLPF